MASRLAEDIPQIVALDGKSRQEAAAFLSDSSTPVPRFLYRFASIGSMAAKGILVESALWLASPASFNDPDDSRAHVTVEGPSVAARRRYLLDGLKNQGIKKRRAEQLASQIMAGETWRPALQAAYKAHVGEIGISCLAGPGSARSALMWAYYAGAARGVCFQFHTPRSPRIFWRARPVTYVSDIKRIDWLDRTGRRDGLFEALYEKHEAWEHENEYRIVEPDRANTAMRFPAQALTGVVLGSRASSSEEDALIVLCDQRARAALPMPRLFRAAVSEGAYGLRVQRAHDLEARVVGGA